jgi:hypothetical protein
MATGIGTTSSLSTTSGISDAAVYMQKALGLSTSTSPKKSVKIIDSMKSELESKKQQYEQINDLLLLIDIDLDMYDELITNIDKKIPEPIQQINTKITAVQDAYRNRVTVGCKNDLEWVVSSVTINRLAAFYGSGTIITTTYKVQKKSSEYRQINYYGAKYYKRPKDRDYGSSAIKEIPSASVGIGSTYMVVYDSTTDSSGFTILSGIQINDTITDSIEQPSIFTLGNLPEVVGFGSTSILGINTTFGGTISVGSTVLAYAGINTTSSISTGDPIWRTGITSTDSVVVGFGTTNITVTGINTLGVTTTYSIDTTSIILSKPAIGSTTQSTFNVGIYTSYPTIFISETTATGTLDDNFFVIRQTGSAENFDPTTNGENPVEIGIIKDDNKTGYGHLIQLVNNGNPDVTKTYTEEIDPEPSVGAGYAFYYEGNELWPGRNVPVYGGVGSTTIVGYAFSYASEGQTITTLTGIGLTQPVSSTGIAYTSTSPLAPSASVCSAANDAISTAESELNSIKTTNLPIINDYISKSTTLRTVRDSKQTKAWAYRRGRGSINKEMQQLQSDANVLESLDLEEFE